VNAEDGTFVADLSTSASLPPVPPGKYRLFAWHPDLGERVVDVSLSGRKPKESVGIRY